MTCPHCRGAEKIFDQGTAERDLKAYRAHGPGTTTRLLIAALKAAGVADRTLLDIGGGAEHRREQLGASNLRALACHGPELGERAVDTRNGQGGRVGGRW